MGVFDKEAAARANSVLAGKATAAADLAKTLERKLKDAEFEVLIWKAATNMVADRAAVAEKRIEEIENQVDEPLLEDALFRENVRAILGDDDVH